MPQSDEQWLRDLENKEVPIFDALGNNLSEDAKPTTDHTLRTIMDESTFNEYQDFVKTMKVYPEKHAIVYPALGLCGEAGEIAEKIKKWLRGDRELDKDALLKELGDPLWYIASLADDLGFTLQQVVDANVEKLTSRKERDVVKGSGDNR